MQFNAMLPSMSVPHPCMSHAITFQLLGSYDIMMSFLFKQNLIIEPGLVRTCSALPSVGITCVLYYTWHYSFLFKVNWRGDKREGRVKLHWKVNIEVFIWSSAVCVC